MEPVTSNITSKKKFVLMTLLIWLLFLLIALPQWMIMCLYSKDPLKYTLVLFAIGFILLSCIHMFETLRYKRPWNFVAVFIAYEVLTVGMGLYLTKWNLINTLILIGVGIIVAGLIMLVSWLMVKWREFPDPSKIAVMGCIGFVLVFCIRSIDVFNKWFFLRDIEVAVFLASVIIVMTCHILISNENFDLLRTDDAMHVAFVLHLCYMLLLVGGRIAILCIEANIKYFEQKGKETTRTPLKMLQVRRSQIFAPEY